MTDEPQPELRWAPREPKPSNARKVWLIVGLSVVALALVGALLFFLLPRGEQPDPDGAASPTPSSSPSASESATPSPSAEPTSEPEPSRTPITTPPPVADPSVNAFRGTVGGWLDDALVGLDIVSESTGQDALSVIETLQADSQRLSEALPPTSIESEWREGTEDYAERLRELRAASNEGRDTADAIDAARSAAESLRRLVGL